MMIDIERKLNGSLPITREELLTLVSSWGREDSFYTIDSNNKILPILALQSNECYDLSKLDVSLIDDMQDVFRNSSYPLSDNHNKILDSVGNISNWDTSNVTIMDNMFYKAKNFNDDLNNWNTNKLESLWEAFVDCHSFDKPLYNWNFNNIKECESAFRNALAFEDKYNDCDRLPTGVVELKSWFKDNRESMIALSMTTQDKRELDSFFNKFDNQIDVSIT